MESLAGATELPWAVEKSVLSCSLVGALACAFLARKHGRLPGGVHDSYALPPCGGGVGWGVLSLGGHGTCNGIERNEHRAQDGLFNTPGLPIRNLRLRRRGLELVALALLISPGCALSREFLPPEPTPPQQTASPTGKVDSKLKLASGTAPRASGSVSANPEASLTVVPAAPIYPIDLGAALRLAEVENPEIAQARAAILAALAVQQGARALMLPSLNAGTNYHGHTGNLQRSSGTIFNLSEQSLYVGGGARVLAAETVGVPAVSIASPLADAIYAPLAARQRLDGARFQAAATFNAVLLDVALLHQDLLSAEALLQARRQTEAEAAEVARLTAVYAQTGQGREADADRAATELKHRQLEVQQAEEAVPIASARLARRLHLDPSVQLRTVESQLAPLALIDMNTSVDDLIRVALQQRPEMGAQATSVAASETGLRQEKARPFLPFVWVGFSSGAFGGGSNVVPPLLGNFAGRTDFDVRVIWTLQNFGLGNLALQRQRRAEVGQAVAVQSIVVNQIRREVASAHAEALAFLEQNEVAVRQLETAELGYKEDLLRIQEPVRRTRPIELVNSLDLLAEARRNQVAAILGYNRAQFQLFVSLGSPPPPPGPAGPPPGPPPIAAPPLPPLGSNPVPAAVAPAATAAARAGTALPEITRQ